jgi:hypothetical protein
MKSKEELREMHRAKQRARDAKTTQLEPEAPDLAETVEALTDELRNIRSAIEDVAAAIRQSAAVNANRR